MLIHYNAEHTMSPAVLYITQGKINLKEPGKTARPIESKFGQSLVDRAAQIRERSAWKTQGTGAQFMSGGMLWGRGPGQDPAAVTVAITGISRGTRDGEFLYSLASDEVAGVFALRNQAADEQRLFHTADFRISQLSAHPSQDRVACVVQHRDISNIAVMRGDGAELTDVTQGDSVDRAPSWVPGSEHEMIYQSAGIARNQQGVNAGAAPACIEKLNLESGEMATIVQDPACDFLDPRMDREGNLYCIRKPYRSLHPKFNLLRALLDLVLFPFRLLYALFQFVNIFTMRYTGKTLVTSGDGRQKQADLRQMMMLGNLMQAQREAEQLPEQDREGLVAKSWELIRKTPAGNIEVWKRAFCPSIFVTMEQSCLPTQGRVFARYPDGKKEQLANDRFISQVIAVPAT